MATTYKTPGVYLEEISKFPPSVSQVETAIPAFIGYTQKAVSKTNSDANDLIGKAKRITSMLEYETYFGYAQDEIGFTVTVKESEDGVKSIFVPKPAATSPYKMYYSMQMYFSNGGGPCYIVSAGVYSPWTDVNTLPVIDKTALLDGLEYLKKEDEPTLIVFPDATGLAADSDYYELCNASLMQCHDLQDRFAIIDAFKDDPATIEALRTGLNLEKDYLKYGAVYYPFLNTSLNYQIDQKQVTIQHFVFSANAMDTALRNLNAIAAANEFPKRITDLYGYNLAAGTVSGSIKDAFFYIEDASGFNNSVSFASTPAKVAAFSTIMDGVNKSLSDLVSYAESVNQELNAAIASSEEDVNSPLYTAMVNALAAFNAYFNGAAKLKEITANLIDLLKKLKAETSSTKIEKLVVLDPKNIKGELSKIFTYAPILGLPKPNPPASGLTVTVELMLNLRNSLSNLITAVNDAQGIDTNNGELNGRMLGDIETKDNATFYEIKNQLAAYRVVLPPSSAMAGIYARVDTNQGVWKAPANVGVVNVIKPSVQVTHKEQEGLNVDTTGKSINVIRSFTGKGTLVWGARTLAGNDNEWRYISVRRFFNMVEESVKKATEQFVFEGNDANTWVRLQAMIENFLTLQWRAGALTGAKPEEAFYVNIGLGKTMTALDILEGRMNVEIGMAVVRPAEFIILKFSHKMQES